MVGRIALNSQRMALETSATSPAPVRQIANLVSQYVDRLGAVWVEGQIAQVSRRPGLQTVFMTLRDSVADISVPLTCPRTLVDSLATPLVEGASVVVLAKPSYYANRGTFSLAVREIRMVGLGELMARLEQRRQLLAAEGLFAGELKRPLPFLPGRVGLVTAPGSAAERDVLDNARRRWPGVVFEVAHATMQGQRAAAEVMEALGRLDRDPTVEVIVVARGGGSFEDLLPFSDEGLVRAVAAGPHARGLGDRPRAGLPAARLRRRRPRVDADRRRQARGPRRGRGGTPRADRPRPAALGPGRLARPGAGRSRRAPQPPGAGRPAQPARRPPRRGRRSSGTGPAAACGTPWTGPSDDIGHQRARARALSPLATLERGYSVLQDAAGHVVTSVAVLEPDAPISVRVADGRVHAVTTSTTRTELLEENDG